MEPDPPPTIDRRGPNLDRPASSRPRHRVASSEPGRAGQPRLAWRRARRAPARRLCRDRAVLTLFLPWYQETVFATDVKNLQAASATLTGWGAFSFVEAAVLLVAAGVLTLLFQRAEGRAFHLPGGDGGVIIAAGVWTCLLIVWRIFDKQGRQPRPDRDHVRDRVGHLRRARRRRVARLRRLADPRRAPPEPPLPGEASGRCGAGRAIGPRAASGLRGDARGASAGAGSACGPQPAGMRAGLRAASLPLARRRPSRRARPPAAEPRPERPVRPPRPVRAPPSETLKLQDPKTLEIDDPPTLRDVTPDAALRPGNERSPRLGRAV